MTDAKPFSVVLPPDPEELRRLREEVGSWLGTAGVDGAVRDAIVLATHEAAASAMGSPGEVEVDVTRDENTIRVAVTSADGWTSPDADLGGRRMSVVRGLVNDATFEKSAGRPSLRFQKRL